MIQRVKTSVTHQGIGGKEFKIDWRITETLSNAEVMTNINFACSNFRARREDFNMSFKHKLYYVQIDGLGYVIAEDEIDNILEMSDINMVDPNCDIVSPNDVGGGSGSGAMAMAVPERKTDPIMVQLSDKISVGLGVAMSPEDLMKSINSSANQNTMIGSYFYKQTEYKRY